MKKINERFNEIKKELAALEKRRKLRNAEMEQMEMLYDELLDQISEIRKKRELGKD